MDCLNCGAPLTTKSCVCTFCASVNDTDLRAIGRHKTASAGSEHVCPRCEVKMETVSLGTGDACTVERCGECLGMFFGPQELDAMIDASVTRVHETDYERLDIIVEEESRSREQVKYVKCPDCRQMMHRKSFGRRSGVIVDSCRHHGVWLDGGELAQILKWVAAGGRIHEEKKQQDRQRRELSDLKLRRFQAEQERMGPSLRRYAGEDFLVTFVRGLFRLLR